MVRRLRFVGIVAVIALVALFTLVPLAGAAPRSAETKNVAIKDFAFEPKTISINRLSMPSLDLLTNCQSPQIRSR